MRIEARPSRGLLRDAVAMTLALSSGAWAPGVLAGPETFTARAGVTESHDDNIFRLPEEVTPPRGGSRSDLILSTTLGVNVARDISRQHVEVDASIANTRYREHSELDNTGNALRASWQGEFGSHWKNDFVIENSKQLSNFADFRSTEKNIVQIRGVSDSLSYRITPEIFIAASAGSQRQSNSAETLRIADYSASYRELGVLFISPSSNQLKVSYRETDGGYPTSQLVAASRRPAPISNKNNYVQRNLDLSGDWMPTGNSRFSGRVGLARRKYIDVSSRDFNGSTGDLSYFWNPGGNLKIDVEARRIIDTKSDPSSNNFLTKQVMLRPAWTLTEKIVIAGTVDWMRRDLLGDPTGAINLYRTSGDSTHTFALSLGYKPRKALNVALNLRKERRISDIALANYIDKIATIFLTIDY